MTEKTVSLELMPSTVDAEILRLSGLLETLTEKLAKAIQEEAIARTSWKQLEAKSLLISDRRSEDLRRAEAIDRWPEAYIREGVATAEASAYAEKCRSCRMRIEAFRTLASNLRSMA